MSLVSNVIAKAESAYTGALLSASENPFSANKVTGASVNFPIARTCAPKEVYPAQSASVIFFDRYKPPAGAPMALESICPLNTLADISSTCEACRRCFDGSAVAHRRKTI